MQSLRYERKYKINVTPEEAERLDDDDITTATHEKCLDNLEKLCGLNSSALVGEIDTKLLRASLPVEHTKMYLGPKGSFVINESEWYNGNAFTESTLVLFKEGKKPETLIGLLDKYYGRDQKESKKDAIYGKIAWRMY